MTTVTTLQILHPWNGSDVRLRLFPDGGIYWLANDLDKAHPDLNIVETLTTDLRAKVVLSSEPPNVLFWEDSDLWMANSLILPSFWLPFELFESLSRDTYQIRQLYKSFLDGDRKPEKPLTDEDFEKMCQDRLNQFSCDYCDDNDCDRCRPNLVIPQKVTFYSDDQLNATVITKTWLGSPIRFRVYHTDKSVWISRNDLVDKLDKQGYERWSLEEKSQRHDFCVDAACDFAQSWYTEKFDKSSFPGLSDNQYGVWEYAIATETYARYGFLPKRFHKWLLKTLEAVKTEAGI